MYVRFGSALILVVSISLWGVALEKKNLDLKRQVTQQTFQQSTLQEQQVAARLQVQQLSAPTRTARELERSRWAKRESGKAVSRQASSTPAKTTRSASRQDP